MYFYVIYSYKGKAIFMQPFILSLVSSDPSEIIPIYPFFTYNYFLLLSMLKKTLVLLDIFIIWWTEGSKWQNLLKTDFFLI